jgi:hypothetical protein
MIHRYSSRRGPLKDFGDGVNLLRKTNCNQVNREH